MKKLKELSDRYLAKTIPAPEKSIANLEEVLGFKLTREYKEFLSTFGVISYGAHETYGLGVPTDYYLNVINIYNDLNKDPEYPKSAIPLMEIGDGQYYLYDNSSARVLIWATPNGGIVKYLDISLENFLALHIFDS